MCSHGWQRNREFTRDVRPVQIALQQTQNLKFSPDELRKIDRYAVDAGINLWQRSSSF